MPVWKVFFLEMLTRFFCGLRFFVPLGRIFLRAYYLSGLRSAGVFAPASTQLDGPVRVVGTGKVRLGEYCRLGRDVLFETQGNAEIVLGDHVRINDGSIIAAHAGITIGDDTLIGEYVSIRDADHGMVNGELIRKQTHLAASIRIGNDAWISRGCCVLKGVAIGDGAVIGANSVVTRDAPALSICVGAPAREIRKR